MSMNSISIHAPLAGCDGRYADTCRDCTDFNPRTPCGVRHTHHKRDMGEFVISIHAPLAGCDSAVRLHPQFHGGISIHAPLAGCDDDLLPGHLATAFQSTHPLRGATLRPYADVLVIVISIHAPLAGCDRDTWLFVRVGDYFNPRTPCGVRRPQPLRCPMLLYFNPRTPCGVRRAFTALGHVEPYFNPRTPCGVRQQKRTKKTALFLN